jgi:hypothetical protein
LNVVPRGLITQTKEGEDIKKKMKIGKQYPNSFLPTSKKLR